MSASDRRRLFDHHHSDLSARRQCELLGVACAGVYQPANDDDDLPLTLRIDELFKPEDIYLKGYGGSREADAALPHVSCSTHPSPTSDAGSSHINGVWRDGIGSGLVDPAADVTFRLDNTSALLMLTAGAITAADSAVPMISRTGSTSVHRLLVKLRG
jgi:hypothetical protein